MRSIALLDHANGRITLMMITIIATSIVAFIIGYFTGMILWGKG